MKKKLIAVLSISVLLCASISACNSHSASSTSAEVSTTATETTVESESELANKEEIPSASTKITVDWETIAPEDIDNSCYEISKGTWFYHGIEDEKSIDMDGLKGFTTYTVEAIPETDGYLQYLGVNPDGFHEFEVYDIFGQYFTSMIFVSEEQFYLGGDEDAYYVKWDY